MQIVISNSLGQQDKIILLQRRHEVTIDLLLIMNDIICFTIQTFYIFKIIFIVFPSISNTHDSDKRECRFSHCAIQIRFMWEQIIINITKMYADIFVICGLKYSKQFDNRQHCGIIS